ncbi:MAG: DUF488 domain-containing protein [Candidatus Micrarchaeaceae archaeon]
MLVGVKRIYDKPSITDGKRVFVDRLWPRGVKKSTVNIDIWMKEVAPSDELRQWFNHEPEKWDGFSKKYREELAINKHFEELLALVKSSDVTLLYSAKDIEHNNAVVLSEMLKERL